MSGDRIHRVAGGALDASIALYQWVVRPLLGPNCRFAPSCSDYAREAIAVHGPRAGLALSVTRICRCHPWCEGGFDPVPAASPQPPACRPG